MKATVFGAAGFIGTRLASFLESCGHDVTRVARDGASGIGALGHAFWCAGLTGDFGAHPWETLHAHVTDAARILQQGQFDSFTYLSSTRVYANAASTREDAALVVRPELPGDLYNLTKLTGEAACFITTRASVRVARLSNVYGAGASPSFLRSVLESALQHGRIDVHGPLDTERDHVSVDDVVRALEHIALRGRHRLYNVASGVNVPARSVVTEVARLTGATLNAPHASTPAAPPHAITIERLQGELGSDWRPRALLEDLPALIEQTRKEIS